MKKYFVLFLLAANVYCETNQTGENHIADYPIDLKYKAGSYLIYDCKRSHYACVDKDGHSSCKEERAFAIQTKEKALPCAPLKKFDDKKSCVLKQYEVVAINAAKRFCYPK